MFEIPLNKFGKEERVIELHKQGKTIRQIAPIVHMSLRDISKIIKAYDKKIIIEQTPLTIRTYKDCSEISHGFGGIRTHDILTHK